MKIGIMTYHSVTNYGTAMQCIGLYGFLKEHFPNDTIEVINYQPW